MRAKQDVLWVLTADGDAAQVFEQARRGALLIERPDVLGALAFHMPDPDIMGPLAAVISRLDTRRRSAGRRLFREERYLIRVARRINEAGAQGAFDHLIVMAPLLGLGMLLRALDPAVRERVRHSIPKSFVRAPVMEIERCLGNAEAMADAFQH